ncbi:MAG: dimethylargininase [Rhodoglobus sp.]
MPIAPVSVSARPLSFGRRIAAALITGLGVAVIAHVVTVLIFFGLSGATSDKLTQISDFFLPVSLLLFVLVALGFAVGAARTWYSALIMGIVTGCLAAVIGTVITAVMGGTPFSIDVLNSVVANLLGSSLIYVAVVAAVTVWLGRIIWASWNRFTAPSHPIALIRQPSARLSEGQVTHIERSDIDATLADEQWDAYVEALEAAGFDTVEIATADDHPDSVFVQDTVVILGATAVITSPGAESRRGETHDVRTAVKKLGFAIKQISLPGTLDGADVLQVGTTLYVGRTGRTNAEGIAQFRAIANGLGYTVVAVPISKALHLKSLVTALPDGTVVGAGKLVDAGLFERFLALPEAGAAVVILSADTVLMAESAPKSIALIENLGYTVVTVNVSEFEKLEGRVTCLSVRIP